MQQGSFCRVSPWHIRQAVRTLKQGGLLAYPTEAVYGLGCLPDNHQALQRLLQLKQRPEDKGLILLASELAQLERWLSPVPTEIMDKVQASWPGPVTWIMPTPAPTSSLIKGRFNSIAVRISAHPLVREICQQCQSAIVSTSANITGRNMSYSALDVRRHFANQLDYILHGPLGDSDKPTVIKDALSGQIIRS